MPAVLQALSTTSRTSQSVNGLPSSWQKTGFVDGSGWRGAYDILKKDGYKVSVVQNPTLSLAGDVAATKQVIDGRRAGGLFGQPGWEEVADFALDWALDPTEMDDEI